MLKLGFIDNDGPPLEIHRSLLRVVLP